jgi:hypothetical protein
MLLGCQRTRFELPPFGRPTPSTLAQATIGRYPVRNLTRAWIILIEVFRNLYQALYASACIVPCIRLPPHNILCYVDWILYTAYSALNRFNLKWRNRLRTATFLDLYRSPHSANPSFSNSAYCWITLGTRDVFHRTYSIPMRHGSHLVLVILEFSFRHRFSQPVTVADRSQTCTVFARSDAVIVGSNPT